jgi:hypothetical protein
VTVTSSGTGRLTFGIYPGSAAGDNNGEIVAGPADDPRHVIKALDELQGRDGRNVLGPAGLSALPLRITEHGWPTGPGRPPERQAEVVEAVVTTVARNARPLGLTGYTHFSLRDADSRNSGLFYQFGLMTDDYTPKPAFGTYRELIDAFSG